MSSRFVFFLPDAKGGVNTFIDNYVRVIKNTSISVVKYKVMNALSAAVHRHMEGDIELLQIGFSKYSTERSRFNMLRKIIADGDVLICSDSFELECINYFRLQNKTIFILHGDLTHYLNTLNAYSSFIDLVFCVSSGLKTKYAALFPDLEFEVSHPFLLDVPEVRLRVPDKLTCVFVGKFEFQKGADLFLDLVESFTHEISWMVAVIKQGSEIDLLDKIPSHVKVYIDLQNVHVLDVLEGSDILIFPSRTEGFGISVLEAMSRGVIPIVLDIPIGIPDQVIHNFNGFIIDISKWNEVPDYLKKLQSDKGLLLQMKSNAFEYAKNKFNSISIASNFVEEVNKIGVGRKKAFRKMQKQYLDWLPEAVYRAFKFLHNRIKYG